MTGFEPRTSGIGSDRSTNWATTTAHELMFVSESKYLKKKVLNKVNFRRKA